MHDPCLAPSMRSVSLFRAKTHAAEVELPAICTILCTIERTRGNGTRLLIECRAAEIMEPNVRRGRLFPMDRTTGLRAERSAACQWAPARGRWLGNCRETDRAPPGSSLLRLRGRDRSSRYAGTAS